MREVTFAASRPLSRPCFNSFRFERKFPGWVRLLRALRMDWDCALGSAPAEALASVFCKCGFCERGVFVSTGFVNVPSGWFTIRLAEGCAFGITYSYLMAQKY